MVLILRLDRLRYHFHHQNWKCRMIYAAFRCSLSKTMWFVNHESLVALHHDRHRYDSGIFGTVFRIFVLYIWYEHSMNRDHYKPHTPLAEGQGRCDIDSL